MQNRFIKYIYIYCIICILNINNVFAGCKEEFPSLTCSTYNSTYESNKVCECVSCPTGYSIGSKSGTSANNYAIYSTCVSSSVSGSTVSGGTTCVAGTNCRSQNTTVNGVFYCWTGGSCSIGKLSGWMGSTNCLTSTYKGDPSTGSSACFVGGCSGDTEMSANKQDCICKKGYWGNPKSGVTCTKCPDGMTTAGPGATEKQACCYDITQTYSDSKGSYKYNGLCCAS